MQPTHRIHAAPPPHPTHPPSHHHHHHYHHLRSQVIIPSECSEVDTHFHCVACRQGYVITSDLAFVRLVLFLLE